MKYTKAQVKSLQSALVSLGENTGGIDGDAGPKTKQALKNVLANVEAKVVVPSTPEKPDLNLPININLPDSFEPKIVVVKGVQYKTHGKFKTKSGKAQGLVVHYTVGGRNAASARGVVASLAKRGLGCPVMDEDGIIYVPENFNWLTDVAYHAGDSSWKGKTAISTYNIGMEICNWGSDGPKRGATDLRASKGEENIKKGVYQKYTAAQEATLINVCLWLKKNCPEFSFDMVVGHDECAPKRKQDPGASLSMTMPQLRAKLAALWKQQK